MPRKPTEKVIEYRITMGDWERTRVDGLMAGVQFNQIATPIVSLMKDVTGMAALYIILNALFPDWAKGLDLDALDGTDEKGWRDYFEGINLAGGAAGAAAGGYAGSWGGPWGIGIGAALGGLTGILAVEGAEELYEDVTAPVRSYMLMLSLRRAAKQKGLVY